MIDTQGPFNEFERHQLSSRIMYPKTTRKLPNYKHFMNLFTDRDLWYIDICVYNNINV